MLTSKAKVKNRALRIKTISFFFLRSIVSIESVLFKSIKRINIFFFTIYSIQFNEDIYIRSETAFNFKLPFEKGTQNFQYPEPIAILMSYSHLIDPLLDCILRHNAKYQIIVLITH